jgi:hypothetical protein
MLMGCQFTVLLETNRGVPIAASGSRKRSRLDVVLTLSTREMAVGRFCRLSAREAAMRVPGEEVVRVVAFVREVRA